MTGPYTQPHMDPERTSAEPREGRFDGLLAEAKAALGYSANTVRSVRDRYRDAYQDQLAAWQKLRDDLDALERRPRDDRPRVADESPGDDGAAAAAEAGAADARLRATRSDVEILGSELRGHQTELTHLDVAIKSLEDAWVFLERGDASLVSDPEQPASGGDMRMRLIEAQEGERARLAQEIHDGPAQALSSAIFQADYIERVLGSDLPAARAEITLLRNLLRRELDDVRSFISQLRPPLLAELGLDGALRDTVDHMAMLIGIPIDTDLGGPFDGLEEAQQTVVLRIVQEALQNVRKHADATTAAVVCRVDDGELIAEIRDDGRGFDVGAVAARGRRNFGLQFMRERAELIGARLEVRSRPDGGTIVRLAIPLGEEESR